MTEANRWLLYAALFGVLVLLLRDDRLGTVVVGAGAAAILALGGYLAVRMLAGSGDELFLGGRLNEPLGYVNGQAGYLLLGVWPLIALAERARSPLLAGGGLAGATFLGGARAARPDARRGPRRRCVSALLLLVAVPGRTRRAWALVVAGAGHGGLHRPGARRLRLGARRPAAGRLRAPRRPRSPSCSRPSAAGAVWARPRSRSSGGWGSGRRRAAVRLGSAGGSASLVVAAVGARGGGRPGRARCATSTGPSSSSAARADDSSRFTTGGGNRYDYWRVAWNQFEDEPLRGIGAGNYDRTYFLERRTPEDIRQPHSIELQTLGELGLVGGAAAGGVPRGDRWPGSSAALARLATIPRSRLLAVAAGGTFVVWLVHTSVDWLHLIPG